MMIRLDWGQRQLMEMFVFVRYYFYCKTRVLLMLVSKLKWKMFSRQLNSTEICNLYPHICLVHSRTVITTHINTFSSTIQYLFLNNRKYEPQITQVLLILFLITHVLLILFLIISF